MLTANEIGYLKVVVLSANENGYLKVVVLTANENGYHKVVVLTANENVLLTTLQYREPMSVYYSQTSMSPAVAVA